MCGVSPGLIWAGVFVGSTHEKYAKLRIDPRSLNHHLCCAYQSVHDQPISIMKKIVVLFSLALLLASPLLTLARSKAGRIQAAYLCAFGRPANQAEFNYWNGQPEQTVSGYVNGHRAFIRQSQTEREAVIRRSYLDGMGRRANDGEVKYWGGFNQTYGEMLTSHINYLRANQGEKDKVIQASYLKVLGRGPQAGELTFWRQQTHTYLQLVAMHETWKRRYPNQPNTGRKLMFFGSIASFVQAIITSAQTVAEIVAAGGGNLLAQGASLIGNDGSTLVGNDGASLIGNDSAGIVAAGGGNLAGVGAKLQ